jgi:RNA polymerase sigma-70 factor (ECF subfamily)
MENGFGANGIEEAVRAPVPPRPETLLQEAAAGNAEAFESLYRLFASRVLAFLRRRTPDQGVLGDLLQEVFLAVWKKAALYRPEYGNADQWIFTIARHKLYDFMRKAVRFRKDVFDPDKPPADEADGASRGDLELLSLVERLEPHGKQVVQAVYFDGLTLEEGAARFGVPLGTFKSRLHKALMALRRLSAAAEKGI